MKISVRRSIFETNSSSVHSLTMCNKSDYDAWKDGELIYNYYQNKLVPINDKDYLQWKKDFDEEDGYPDYEYLTYNEFFNDYDKMEYETYSNSHTTPKGEEIVAFGYYGHD